MSAELSGAADPYSINDVQSDAGHVAELIDIALELHLDVPVDEAAGRHQAERISTLLWVARDLAQAIGRSIEKNYASLRPCGGREAP